MADQLCTVDGCQRYSRKGKSRFCSPHEHRQQRYGNPLAGPRGEYGRPAIERFLSLVNFDGEGGCWTTPPTGPAGYGMASTDIRRPNDASKFISIPAHRYMWWIIVGTCAEGELDHLCYRRNCVRLDHLEEVDHDENLRRGNERRRRERAALRLLEMRFPDLAAQL